ncbi:Na+/H+ antiporter NhaA [Undibacterium sp. LX40W]|uniref:Na(+)/H(+) antiporter NhaA n=1 Tax=Undibacterium nitidum TaxID=2762298 RepID=A0A923HUC9_9BURK|nr:MULTISPECIES: Na+/H+ antiporter NhaA [Undibacterium]MBC3882772.1 Na+/H+ antiporter NhaA [Undibacterium nitidum]MBC3893045.1 Na+/H+ antiporter NhaA [Undibacterium sp. LX40W]
MTKQEFAQPQTSLQRLSSTFEAFVNSEKSSGIILILCTLISLMLTNLWLGQSYIDFWQQKFAGLSLELWINDALMAVFFLLIGLELERELYSGELSSFKNALLPIIAAVGGTLAPAAIHFAMNKGLPSQAGIGIPMATDIAFALGALALLGSRIPPALKVFVVAFAVIDDLCAIIIIALFYTAQVKLIYLGAALAIWFVLVFLNRRLRIMHLAPYLIGGVAMWTCMLLSGVHATIAGVMLAFAIPYSAKDNDSSSPSHQLEHALHKPVAFLILPIFALANTAIVIGADWMDQLGSANSVGIISGLIIGKTLGIVLFCILAVKLKWCSLPAELKWQHIIGAGMLGGIGFTMSIFITNLAFSGQANLINASKMAIMVASLGAGLLGLIWLALFCKPTPDLSEQA